MKKIVFGIIASVIAVSSCVEIENAEMTAPIYNSEIVLNVENNTFDNIDVVAYNVTANENYFGATRFFKTIKTYESKEVWPNAISNIKFLGYIGSEKATFGDEKGNLAESFSVNVPSVNNEPYYYGIAQGEVKNNNGTLVYPKNVDMSINLANAFVKYNINNEANAEITSVVLTGASFGGTLTVSQNAFTTKANDNVICKWSNISAPESREIGEGLYVIPQAMGAAGFKMTYNVNGKENYFIYFFSADEKNFESGHEYTINITINQNNTIIASID